MKYCNSGQRSASSIMPVRVGFLTLALLLATCLFAGCAKKSDDQEAKTRQLDAYINAQHQKPLDAVTYLREIRTNRDFLRPAITMGRVRTAPQQEPQPLPGRLIVKIAPSEIAKFFKPEAAGFDIGSLVELNLLPRSLDLRHVGFVGFTRDNRVLLKLFLSREYPLTDLQSAFSSTRGEVYPFGLLQSPNVKSVLVVYDRAVFEGLFSAVFRPNYFHLKPNSQLHHLFENAGVATMRRVFHVVEARHLDGYEVKSFTSLLSTAKAQNPVRAGRAYDYYYSKDPSDILSAFQQHYGYAMPDITDESMISAMQTLKPLLRRQVQVPENMENYFVLTFSPEVESSGLSEALSLLSNYTFIENISFDYPLNPATSDPSYPDQWGLENSGTFLGMAGGTAGFDTKANPAWASTPQLRQIVVAVVDDGIHTNLNELVNRIWTNQYESASPDGVDNDGNGYIDDAKGITTGQYADPAMSVGLSSGLYGTHGTMMAGIIAAEANNDYGISGVVGADDVTLMNLSLGVFSSEGTPCGLANSRKPSCMRYRHPEIRLVRWLARTS